MSKDELMKKIKTELGEMEARFDQLKQKTAKETRDLEDDFQETIADLGGKIDQAKAKYSEIADTADDHWEELKDSLEAGWSETKNMFDEGWDETKSKLESGWDNLSDSVKKLFS